MTNLQIIILSALQGFTEFLPVSSSGHLILLSKFTTFPDQGLAIDVAVHIGSILAVMIYFHRDIVNMLRALFRDFSKIFSRLRKPRFPQSSFQKQKQITDTQSSKLLWMLIVGTIPAVIFGLLLHHMGTEWLRNTKIIGWNILLFGLLLWVADRYLPAKRTIKEMTFKDALLIGFAQCLAMIPGTSRSGITITASRFLKLERREAAKFCMLLSIPAITGAGILVGWEIYQSGDYNNFHYALNGICYSFIASIAAISIMMKWLKNYTFLPFVIYRVALGIFLLLHSYGYL